MSWRQLLWISNLLSLCRIVLVWPLAYALAEPSIIGTVSAVGILLVAGVTDFLHGYLARKFNQVTPLGAALDPITDKLFAAGFMILLIIHRDFPLWLAATLIGRDLLLLLGGLILLRKREVTIPARLFGKYLFLATVILLGSYVIGYPFGQSLATTGVLGLCAGSLFDYATVFRQALSGKPLPAYDPKPAYQKLRVGSTAVIIVVYVGVWIYQQLQ